MGYVHDPLNIAASQRPVNGVCIRLRILVPSADVRGRCRRRRSRNVGGSIEADRRRTSSGSRRADHCAAYLRPCHRPDVWLMALAPIRERLRDTKAGIRIRKRQSVRHPLQIGNRYRYRLKRNIGCLVHTLFAGEKCLKIDGHGRHAGIVKQTARPYVAVTVIERVTDVLRCRFVRSHLSDRLEDQRPHTLNTPPVRTDPRPRPEKQEPDPDERKNE